MPFESGKPVKAFVADKTSNEQLLENARAGVSWAQFTLAALYWLGEGFPMNPNKSIKWLTRAAEQGHPETQYFLGLSYESGQGVALDELAAAS
jgi:uncharacterized protein